MMVHLITVAQYVQMQKDERVKVIHKENGGVSDEIRNAGVQGRKGRIFRVCRIYDYCENWIYIVIWHLVLD